MILECRVGGRHKDRYKTCVRCLWLREASEYTLD